MEPSNHKKGQHLNLRNVAQNFMDGLQRHAGTAGVPACLAARLLMLALRSPPPPALSPLAMHEKVEDVAANARG